MVEERPQNEAGWGDSGAKPGLRSLLEPRKMACLWAQRGVTSSFAGPDATAIEKCHSLFSTPTQMWPFLVSALRAGAKELAPTYCFWYCFLHPYHSPKSRKGCA